MSLFWPRRSMPILRGPAKRGTIVVRKGGEHAMADTTLDQVQQLVDQLTPLEQVRLLEYLASKRASLDAWAEFLRLGDALAAGDPGTGDTLTASVLAMRR